jgi:UDP-N-acetylglucosamine--N-acetylmuramyl-(pentapeptide) pyrophosphoryl-undecaprenol N-acetylglucosamine transferase
MKNAQWVGNPLREAFLQKPDPAKRFEGRTGPLKMLVMGGSLGAAALNEVIPRALALIPAKHRPQVTHQSGAKQIDTLRANYATAGVIAEITAFIDDTASAMAQADLVICRSGASTVTEIAAVGAAAIFVPFPSAVDDHQTHNARYLVDQQAGLLIAQQELTPEKLADILQNLDRPTLQAWALRAKELQKTEATEKMVQACEELSP